MLATQLQENNMAQPLGPFFKSQIKIA